MSGSDSPDALTQTTTQSPSSFAQPYLEQMFSQGSQLANQPYQPYGGQRFAPLTDQHQAGLSMIENRAQAGSPLNATNQSFLSGTMQGQYSPSVGSNQYSGAQTAGAMNPYIGARTNVGSNPYAGANPFLEQSISKTLDDVRGRVNSQFNGNAFGGSANQELLGRELANTSNQMRMQDYGMQQQLAESDIARRAQFEAGDIGRNSQLAQALGQFNAGLSQADTARNAQIAESGLDRNLSAWNTDMQNRMRASALSPQAMSQDYFDAQNMLAAGDINRQASQDQMNLSYDDWLRQMNYPYQQFDLLSNMVRSAAGGTTTSTSPNPYQPSTAGSVLGGGLLGAGLGGMLPSSMFGGYGTALGAGAGALLPLLFG
jgi:hypothetical protein